MSDFDYGAAAELYSSRMLGRKRRDMAYYRFESSAEALRFAFERLPPDRLSGAVLEVGDQRVEGVAALRELYLAPGYPLARDIPLKEAATPDSA